MARRSLCLLFLPTYPWLLIYGCLVKQESCAKKLHLVTGRHGNLKSRQWSFIRAGWGRGITHSFRSWALNIFLFCGLRATITQLLKKKKKIWPQLQISSTLPTLPKIKKTSTRKVCGYPSGGIMSELCCFPCTFLYNL